MDPSPTYRCNGRGHHEMGKYFIVYSQQLQRLGLRRIFTKLEQRSWLKTEAGRGKITV
jgi:hypothetical protein